jgi:hypothetical protein
MLGMKSNEGVTTMDQKTLDAVRIMMAALERIASGDTENKWHASNVAFKALKEANEALAGKAAK